MREIPDIIMNNQEGIRPNHGRDYVRYGY